MTVGFLISFESPFAEKFSYVALIVAGFDSSRKQRSPKSAFGGIIQH